VTQKERQLARYRNNPKHVTFEELKALLEHYGFEVNNYSGGSHFSVSHTKYDIIGAMEPNTIPSKKQHLMEVYVRRSLKWIDDVISLEMAEKAVLKNEKEKTNN